MIYLDYAANTPVDPEVLRCFSEYALRYPGNPNSAHAAGREAKAEMDRVTASLAEMLGCEPEEVIHTSGASESNNLAIKGLVRANRHQGRHIVSTCLEHSSVSGALTYLQQQGYEIDLVNIGRDGAVDLDALEHLLRPDTVLVSVSMVDSELGVRQPVEEIAALLKKHPHVRFHVDAVQAAGKIPISFRGIDCLTLAPHKFYGLNGCGILLKRRGVVLEPLIHGGASATIYRSGTPALALAASAEKALALAFSSLDERRAKVERLSARLRQALPEYPLVRVNSTALSLPHFLNLSVRGVKAADFQAALDRRGVCVSTKSACSVPNTPSRPVFAVTGDKKNALSSWRVSLSHLTTAEEIEEFLKIFHEAYKETVKIL